MKTIRSGRDPKIASGKQLEASRAIRFCQDLPFPSSLLHLVSSLFHRIPSPSGPTYHTKLSICPPRQSMSTDNSLCRVCHLKSAEVGSLLFKCCRGSGQSMIPLNSPAPAQACKPTSPSPPMPSFEPRPFPPLSLTGVPIEYVTDQLHNLATQFWDKPETADCTISESTNPRLKSFSDSHASHSIPSCSRNS